jgi:hypothetical protein
MTQPVKLETLSKQSSYPKKTNFLKLLKNRTFATSGCVIVPD